MTHIWQTFWGNLPTRIVSILVGLVIMTALAIGLPAMGLLRYQLQQQAWNQVERTRHVVQALYSAQQNELNSFALLTAQRPTLTQLLHEANPPALIQYLRQLQLSTDLDVLIICTEDKQILAQVGDVIPHNICALDPVPLFWYDSLAPISYAWMLADHTMPDSHTRVILGIALDYEFANQMRLKTGLEHTLLWQGRPIATSFTSGVTSLKFNHLTPTDRYSFNFNDSPSANSDLTILVSSNTPQNYSFTLKETYYYGTLLPLSESHLGVLVALDVEEIASSEQQLSYWFISIMLASVTISSLIGTALAHQISRPLARLEVAAAKFSLGDLESPVQVETHLREVKILTQTIDEARLKLQHSLQELRAEKNWLGHFLANIAHEFRTPLTALAASIELLFDQTHELSRAELHELLTSLHLGIISLQTLVDNLLESASLETGHFRVSPLPVDLREVIAEARTIMQPLLHKHGQTLQIHIPPDMPLVYADLRRTVQVMVNLLANANKYGPDDAAITIDVEVEPLWVRVEVIDEGAGVLPEFQPYLFQRFASSRRSKSRYGSGLGLSIVKAVVEAHHGQVGMTPRPEGGTIFWFTLPLGGDKGE